MTWGQMFHPRLQPLFAKEVLLMARMVDPLVREKAVDRQVTAGMAGMWQSLLLPLLMALRDDEDRDRGMDRSQDETDRSEGEHRVLSPPVDTAVHLPA